MFRGLSPARVVNKGDKGIIMVCESTGTTARVSS